MGNGSDSSVHVKGPKLVFVSRNVRERNAELQRQQQQQGQGNSAMNPNFLLSRRDANRIGTATAAAEEEVQSLKKLEWEKERRRKARREVRKEIAASVADEVNEEERLKNDVRGKRKTLGRNGFEHSDSEYSLDSDDDETADAVQKWKLRELKRVLDLKRMANVRLEELERIARRKEMTEAEKLENDVLMDNEKRALEGLPPLTVDEYEKGIGRRKKTQHVHLQKWAHGGAYFQDLREDVTKTEYDVLRRDYHNQALDSEKGYDKRLLPEALQLRRGNFGFIGQTKHKSLMHDDTTDQTGLRADPSEREKAEQRAAWIAEKKQEEAKELEKKKKSLDKWGPGCNVFVHRKICDYNLLQSLCQLRTRKCPNLGLTLSVQSEVCTCFEFRFNCDMATPVADQYENVVAVSR